MKKGLWDTEAPDEKVLSGTKGEEVPEEKEPPNDGVGPLTKVVDDELPKVVEGCLM